MSIWVSWQMLLLGFSSLYAVLNGAVDVICGVVVDCPCVGAGACAGCGGDVTPGGAGG